MGKTEVARNGMRFETSFLNKNMGVVNDLVTVDFGAMRHPTSV